MKIKRQSNQVETKARIDGVVRGDKYETSNLHLAVWLHMNGKKLVDIDKSSPRRAIFIFDDFPGRDDLISDFFTDEKLQRFISTMKYLKIKLYQNSPPINYDKE
jgi:hypothetical protein